MSCASVVEKKPVAQNDADTSTTLTQLAVVNSAPLAQGEQKKDTYIVFCNIIDDNFSIVRVLGRGYLCLPLENGDWIEVSSKKMTYWSSVDGIKWQKKGNFHHQIRRFDQDSFLILLAHVKKLDLGTVKFDSILKIDIKTGKTLNQFSIYDQAFEAKEFKGTPLDLRPGFSGEDRILFENAQYEHTHLNSIHFYKDLIIINQAFGDPFALTRNLEFSPVSIWSNKDEQKHDFQILPDGSTLYFKNGFDGKKNGLFQVLHYDKDHKLIFKFPRLEKDFNENSYSGGVEKIGSNYLIGFPSNGKSIIELVSQEGIVLKKALLQFEIQDIRKIPFDNFLELNSVR